MKLKDIYFGKIDAKNELTEDSDAQKEAFEQAYLAPEYVDLDSIEDGRKYIISGLKGIGKTALLRYVDIQLRKNQNNLTSFILFKSDFSSEDRKAFYLKSQSVVDDEEIKEVGDLRDFESIWKWFFFQYIYNCIKDEANNYFNKDDTNWKMYEKCIQCVSAVGDPVVKGISRFIPKIKKGQITISKPGFAVEVGFTLGDNNKIKFSDLVHKTEQFFDGLQATGNKKLYLLVDELEISYEVKRQYERDVRIVRDLVAITEKLNSIFRRNHYPIYIIASIRSEVLNVANATGKEINKCVEDFGIQIVWHQAGGSEHDHPLIQMIMKRLIAAEGLEDTADNREKVWNQYFPDKTVQNQPVERYILYNSWFRPRDIVRMLTKGQNCFPNLDSFTHRVFDGIRKMYSTDSWTECMEELKASYTNEQISAIENVFNGWQPNFTREDIRKRINDLSKDDDRIKSISPNVDKLLEDLYRVGVIGNNYSVYGDDNKIRFVFRGDNKLLTDRRMMIHNALRPYFSL